MDRLPDDQQPKSIASVLGQRQPDREASCPEHGPFTSSNLFRSVWSKCPACTAISEEAARVEREKEEARRKEETHRRMLSAARIPTRFIGRDFDNFYADTEAKRHALAVARDFAESFREHYNRGAGLVLAGMPGTGKSHLAAAILQHLMDKSWDVSYLTCMDLIRSVRDTWRRDSEKTETQALGYLQYLDLLVIDEVGVQYGTDGEQTIIFDVLDRRYREVRPTVILTNQDKEGFKGFIGERTFDRLVETSRWVPFDWPSYRPTARKQGAQA